MTTLLVTLVLGSVVSGCGRAGQPNILDPYGPGAAQIANLWWLMFWLGVGVLLIVFGMALYASRVRSEDDTLTPPPIRGSRLIIWGGIIFPMPILGLVLGYTIYTSNVTSRPSFAAIANQAIGGGNPEWTVDLIGHQFWWEAHYPTQGVVTANEIHIPVGQPVLFRLTSADVIHSFWVPQLHGKLDLIPGQTNRIWIEATEPGIYRGICAEFCGTQHALMHLLIVAQPADEFNAWVARQKEPMQTLTDPRLIHGQNVFMGAGCVYCHTIDGLNEAPATETIGPDLTHVASRMTLAAGTIENNRGNLGGWVLDPHGIKPGNRMPPTRLNSDDFLALLEFLESLQ